jgi:hypothetical protein
LRDGVRKLYNLPKWHQKERVFVIFGAFGIQLAQEARGIQLTQALNLLDGANLVVQTCGIVTTCESFRFQLVF